MNLRALFGAVIITIFTFFNSLSATADEYWNHNDSLIYIMTFVDNTIRIEYSKPRPSLQAQGIVEGTTLFRGTIDQEGHVNGIAYVFKQGCPPAPYHVQGYLNDDLSPLHLYGLAPVRAPDSCVVTGYSENSNSTLIFTFAYSGG